MREVAMLSRRAAAALPLAALLGPAATAVQAPAAGDDAALLDLGRRWDAAMVEMETFDVQFHAIAADDFAQRSDELDAESERLSQLENRLFRAILGTQAKTVAGLAVKARILARELDIDGELKLGSWDLPSVERAEANAADMLDRATWGLVADVLRLAEMERLS